MRSTSKHNVYFVGIGGIGMSAIALYLNAKGNNVAGFDRVSTRLTRQLEQKGIAVHYSAAITNIPEAFHDNENTLVVYTPAVPIDHVELEFFRNGGFEILKRSEILGRITQETTCLAVAGTHGKTTTSAILAHIMTSAGSGATAFLGGISLNYNANLIIGDAPITIVEADEFDRSFMRLSPDIACITSMDPDHLDIYGTPAEMNKTYNDFAQLVSDKLIVRKGLSIQGISYGIEDDSDYEAHNIKLKKGQYYFDIKTPTEKLSDLTIALPGRHNVLNTVAALAMADCFGIPLQVIAEALLSFKGIKRRFNYVVNTEKRVLIDDYAHHPTEIMAVVNALKEMYPNEKLLGVFQPHLFSRTKDFVDDFATSLSGFDELILLDIYPARELPLEGVNSEWLLGKVMLKNKRISSKERLHKYILASEAKVIAMIGAGDIGELVEPIKKELSLE